MKDKSCMLFKGRLYFKTDAAARPDYLEMGMEPFRPGPKQTLKNDDEVPIAKPAKDIY